MHNLFQATGTRGEPKLLKDFLEENAVELTDEDDYQEEPEEVILYGWENQQS